MPDTLYVRGYSSGYSASKTTALTKSTNKQADELVTGNNGEFYYNCCYKFQHGLWQNYICYIGTVYNSTDSSNSVRQFLGCTSSSRDGSNVYYLPYELQPIESYYTNIGKKSTELYGIIGSSKYISSSLSTNANVRIYFDGKLGFVYNNSNGTDNSMKWTISYICNGFD